MSSEEEVRAAAVAWRTALCELIVDFLENGGPLEFKKKYVEEFGKHFNTFAALRQSIC